MVNFCFNSYINYNNYINYNKYCKNLCNKDNLDTNNESDNDSNDKYYKNNDNVNCSKNMCRSRIFASDFDQSYNVINFNCNNVDKKQILKIIQNKVRVPSSLYTMNLGVLNSYNKPVINNVCWNQMSDRAVPSVQKATVPTGFANSLNGKHSSFTSSKPGSQTPGGVGCDIKHNSYARYLNRLKGCTFKKCIAK